MKRLTCILVLAVILFSFGAASAEGAAPQTYQDAGFTFYFSADSGTLVVGGLGAVPNSASWGSVASDVRRLIVAEGINAIPSGAFSRCVNLDTIILPATLRHIDHAAFSGCNSIQTILYPGDLMDLSQIIIENNVLELRKAFTLSRITAEDVNAEIDHLINGATTQKPVETQEEETALPQPAPFPRPHHHSHSGAPVSSETTTPIKPEASDQPDKPETPEKPTVTPITETDKYNRITHQIEILDDGTIIETTSDYPGYDFPYKRSLVTTTAPDGTKTSSYMEIDAGGNVFSRNDYTLDDDGNVTGGSFQTFGSQPGSIAADTDEDGNRILIYTYPKESGINSTKTETLNDDGQVIHSISTVHTIDGFILSTSEQTNTYDENGTILSSTVVETYPDGRISERKTDYESDGRSNTETVTRYNADGDLLYQSTSTSTYEENGGLQEVNTTQGAPDSQRQYICTFTYDENGNRKESSQTTTEEDGTTWNSVNNWNYDENGNLLSTSCKASYADGNTTETREMYDEHGNAIYTYISNTTAEGSTYQSTSTSDYTYDSNGHVILSKRETNDSNGGHQKEVTSYDSEGQQISTVRTLTGPDYETTEQQFWTYGEDGAKSIRNSQTKNNDGSSNSSTVITENGRIASTEFISISTDGSKTQSKTAYNEDGSHSELHSNTYSDGFSWTQETEYDDQGNALNQSTSYQYQNGTSSTEETSFTYDESGNKTAVTEGISSSGATTNSTTVYDSNGQIQSYINESRDENGMYNRWTYDGSSYIDYSSSTDVNGNVFTNTHIYDSDHKSVSSSSETISSDGTVAVYDRQYDEDGRLTTETQITTYANGGQSTAVSTYEYDDEGQPSYTMVTTDPDGNTSTYQYSYDPDNNTWTGTPVTTDADDDDADMDMAEDDSETMPGEEYVTPGEDVSEPPVAVDDDNEAAEMPSEILRISAKPKAETNIPEDNVAEESVEEVTDQNTAPDEAIAGAKNTDMPAEGSNPDVMSSGFNENSSTTVETVSVPEYEDIVPDESKPVGEGTPISYVSPASEPVTSVPEVTYDTSESSSVGGSTTSEDQS